MSVLDTLNLTSAPHSTPLSLHIRTIEERVTEENPYPVFLMLTTGQATVSTFTSFETLRDLRELLNSIIPPLQEELLSSSDLGEEA